MKRLLALGAACFLALLCAACAQGGPAPANDVSGITMYGTLDEGITFKR
jgi:opacity protein-like surface antigen